MRRRTRRIGISAFALVNAALVVPAARAASVYWDRNVATPGAANAGTSANGNWDAATANWTSAPNGDTATGTYAAISGGASTADVIFSAGTVGGSNLASGLSLITVSAATSANSITIKNGAVNITGSAVTVGAGGITMAASAFGASTIASAPISTSQTWTNNSYYALNISSTTGVSSPGTNSTLTFGGSGFGGYNLAGVTNGASGTLNLEVAVANGARVILNGSNSAWTGNVLLTSGILVNNNANALNTVTGGTLSFGGGTLMYGVSADNSAKFSTAANQQYKVDTNYLGVTYASNITSTGGSFTKLGYGTLALTGANSFSGGITVGGGVLSLGNASALGGSGTIDFANGGILRFGGSNTVDYSSRFGTGAGNVIGLDPNGQNIVLASDLTGGSLYLTSNTASGSVSANGNLTSGFGSVTINTYAIRNSNGTETTLFLNGTNNQYTGGTNVLGGLLVVNAASSLGANSAGNVVKVGGSGVLQLNAATNIGSNQTIELGAGLAPFSNGNGPGSGIIGLSNGAVGVLDLRYNPTGGIPTHTSSANSPVVIAVSGVTTGFTTGITLANQEFLGARSASTYSGGAISLDASANDTYRLGGGGWSGISTAILSISGNNVLTNGANPRNLIVGVTPLVDRLTAVNGAGTVSLLGGNNFTGSTLINVGSTLDLGVNGTTTGTILNSSSISLKGTLTITNSTSVAVADRIDNGTTITADGGTFTMGVSQSTTTTEDVGTLALAARQNTFTLNSAGSKATVLQADGIIRNNRATMVVRGSNILGATGTGNVSRLTLDSPSGLTLIGTTDTAGFTSAKDLKIVPWIIASNSGTTTNATFATYDSASNSLRPLSISGETVLLSTATTGQNTYDDFAATTTATINGVSANSIVFTNSASTTLTGTGSLASTSGALASLGGRTITVGALTGSYDAINLGSAGNTEGVVYVESGGILNLNSPVNTGQAWGITKFGNGTLNLGASNTFTGPIVVNAGTLSLNGTNTAGNITINSGTLAATVANALGAANIVVNGGGNLQFGGGVPANTTVGSGTVTLNDGASLTNVSGTSGFFDPGVVTIAGTARIVYSFGGTGSRTVAIPNVVMGANKTLGVNISQGSGNQAQITNLTLNGTNAVIFAPAAGGESFRLGTITEGTANSGLVLSNIMPANTYLGAFEVNGSSAYTGSTEIKTGLIRVTTTGKLGSGDVLVSSGGILELQNSVSIDDLADLTLASGGSMYLNFLGQENVGTLTLGNVTYTSGYFNANTNPDYFTGTGSVAVPEPGSLSMLGLAGAMLLRRRKR